MKDSPGFNWKKIGFALFLIAFVALHVAVKNMRWPGDAPKRLKVGDDAPTFVLSAPTGEKYELWKKPGKAVLICFCETSSSECQVQGRHLVKIAEKHPKKKLDILMATPPPSGDPASENFLKSKDKPPLVVDDSGAIFSKYNVDRIPKTYLVDRSGKIAYIGGEFKADDKKLNKAIVKAAKAGG